MFCWTEELATGNAKIDTQHQELFKQAEEIFTANDANDLERVKKSIDFLINYVSEHFSYEESVMIHHCYENFEEHRDKHTYFVKEIFKYHKKIFENGLDKATMDALKVLMIEWLVDHINHDDKRFTDVIRK